MPPNMADWLGEDHLVWFVLDVVARLDTSVFHARSRLGGAGRSGYDPDMLLGLLIFAYAVGERSSRRIERLCTDHVAFRVACAGDVPDHTTISRFRAEHQEAFTDVFAQVLRLCSVAGMVKVGTIAIDGTKIAANASRGANRSAATVREEARRIAEEILAQAAVTDTAEDHAAAARQGRSDDDLPPGFDSHSGRAANLAKALAELDAQEAAQATADQAAIDEDSARAEAYLQAIEAGQAPRGRPPLAVDPIRLLEAQIARFESLLAALDGKPGRAAANTRNGVKKRLNNAYAKLAAARAAAQDGTVADTRGGKLRARQRRAAGRTSQGLVNTTDPDSRLMVEGSGSGSVQGYNAQFAVTDDHFVVGVHLSQDANDTGCYTPTLAAAALQSQALGKNIDLVLADAGYFTQPNLTAPGPDRLIAPGKNHSVHTNVDPQATAPAPETDPAETMRQRLKDPHHAERYKRRSATVEPVFAHLKDQIGLRRFARRGLQAVTAELHLAATALNLNRLHQAALNTT